MKIDPTLKLEVSTSKSSQFPAKVYGEMFCVSIFPFTYFTPFLVPVKVDSHVCDYWERKKGMEKKLRRSVKMVVLSGQLFIDFA